MKIGIEAQRVFRAGKHGMDVVALEMMRRLQQTDQVNEYYLFAADGPDAGCINETKNFHKRILRGTSYLGWEQFSLPAAIKKFGLDMIHCTANTAPLVCPVPLVLTLHDIIYLEKISFSGSWYQNAGNLYRKFIVPHAVKKAARIITVSSYEKKIISDYFPDTASKTSVIYNGVDERFHDNYGPDDTGPFKKKYSLPDRFILFLGNTAPKKNTTNVIKAFAQYCETVSDPLPIVIADYKQEHIDRTLGRINKSKVRNLIVLPGYIPTSHMPLLYNSSELFLYPSLRESFGMPILEAMACGVPVITSAVSAMPETAGDAACLIDPFSGDAIAGAIGQVLSDRVLYHSLREKGLARARLFSWKNSAEQLLRLYASLA